MRSFQVNTNNIKASNNKKHVYKINNSYFQTLPCIKSPPCEKISPCKKDLLSEKRSSCKTNSQRSIVIKNYYNLVKDINNILISIETLNLEKNIVKENLKNIKELIVNEILDIFDQEIQEEQDILKSKQKELDCILKRLI